MEGMNAYGSVALPFPLEVIVSVELLFGLAPNMSAMDRLYIADATSKEHDE